MERTTEPPPISKRTNNVFSRRCPPVPAWDRSTVVRIDLSMELEQSSEYRISIYSSTKGESYPTKMNMAQYKRSRCEPMMDPLKKDVPTDRDLIPSIHWLTFVHRNSLMTYFVTQCSITSGLVRKPKSAPNKSLGPKSSADSAVFGRILGRVISPFSPVGRESRQVFGLSLSALTSSCPSKT